ncbi:MAG: histidine kinase N-terminal 7TM domain-containing protein [Candidatus Limnocylindria bacterium]
MGIPEQLEIVAQGMTAVLATWLGLTVAVRAPRQPGSRAFTFLTLLLVIWSVSVVVQRLTADQALERPLNAVEVAAAFLLPPAVLHVAMAITAQTRRSSLRLALLVAFYAVSGTLAAISVVDPALEPRVASPHLELAGIPGEAIGWAWIVIRLVIFAAALVWIGAAIGATGPDVARRRQLLVTFATVFVGVAGATARIVPPISDTDPWIGVSLITVAVVLASYAVFAQGLFFTADVAGRAFRYSVAVGLIVTAYVALLVALDRGARDLLAIELPLLSTLALVVTIALFDPISARLRAWLAGEETDRAYERLLRALGDSIFTAQRPEHAIDPALARLTRTFSLTGAEAIDGAGERMARHGTIPDSPLVLRLPLRSEGEDYGWVAFGPKRSMLPFTPHERELLSLVAGYLGASLRLGERQDEQAEALQSLTAERTAVATTGTALHEALSDAPAATAVRGLHVFALGPLRVQRGGDLIRQWGGEKAGTRQAEAMFAFLYDRGERGVAKDEAIELIWPDVDLDRADLAFHRTLGGLRRTLQPERRRADGGGPVIFHNDRYRLDPSIVAWSDADAFVGRMTDAGASADPDEALHALHEARALYRGDYLDDCPFYGDSSFVEDRREMLRTRYVDLLLAIGERQEARGDRASAAAAFREARLAAGDDCPPADAGLARLGVAPSPGTERSSASA